MNTRVKIWPTSLPSGKVHSYDVQTKDGLTAAAEALAHFASLNEGPDITLDSTLEVHLDQGDVPEQVFTVRVVLDYLRSQPALLDGLENKSDLDVLRRLTGRFKTLDSAQMSHFAPVWADAEGIDAQFEDLAATLRHVDGVESVRAIFRYETRGLTPEGWSSELVVIVSAAAGAIGIKMLDILGELVTDYVKRKRDARYAPTRVSIYDHNGQVVKKVRVDTPRE